MGDRSLFFYGTLLHPAILSRVIHGPSNPTFNEHNTYVTTCSAVLPAHSRHRVRGADYPAVIPESAPDAGVRGTLARGLTDNDVRRLDIFEGDEYARLPVKVIPLLDQGHSSMKGRNHESDHESAEKTSVAPEEVQAETYIWIASRNRLEKEEWDFDSFVQEKMHFWLGGETEKEEFGAVDADHKVDGTGGRSISGDIGRALQKEYGSSVEKSEDSAREMVRSAV
ncbi:hypothetical protein ANO11243_019680 [Dothideomycetidae sp. 11243]|nr:hypothetical protein ANO11243_019680 [fungal sp. No.11243]